MANKEYKSDVFSMLLQDKKRAMEIYNAINGTDYDDPELVEMTTLDDKSFSLTVRNDASFILDANLSLYEHQSTYCPNMPLRDLLYFASIIQKQIKAQKRDIYGGRILKIPVPHFVVFYNGKEDAPDQYDLRLSDAFEKETKNPEIELVCHVYNINSGKNTPLLSKCQTLREYMYFVDMVRKNNEISGNLEDAIEKAINQCMEENVLRDFLAQHREEVMHVMTLDYTFERRLEMQRAEAIEDGERIGKEIGKEEKLSEQIRKKIQKGKPLDQIADELEEVPETIRPLYEKIKQEMLQ
ncbi:hypothetical protein [Roseburia faecis]|jgi:hypothetical protein|uniref:hypothetical protein n=1 Tax=Roseburia faecis TaxID=301302 RepID=UPI0032BF3CB4